MDKSLLNPYQCRYFGIDICDDPTDRNRDFGLQADDRTFVPFTMNGSTCGFESWYPTDEELESCHHITFSHEDDWNPSVDLFQISSMEAEKNYHRIHSRHIAQVRGHTPTASPINIIRDDIVIPDFDRAMVETSLELVDGLMAERMISKITTCKTRDGYATITNDRHHEVNTDLLAQKWGIGMEKAKDTLKCTTQKCIRSAILPLTRRYRIDLMSQRLRRLSTTWYTDTLFSQDKSVVGNKCAQMFTDGEGFAYVHPMRSKSEAGEALQRVAMDVGVPNTIINDGAPEETGLNTKFMEIVKRFHIDSRTTEPYSPWQSRAEKTIGIIKGKAKRRRIRRNIPKRVWDFGIVWEAEIYCRTAGKDGRTALERITGDTIDISEWIEFEFYDLCWYWDNQYETNESNIGRWLGVSHRVGSALCY